MLALDRISTSVVVLTYEKINPQGDANFLCKDDGEFIIMDRKEGGKVVQLPHTKRQQ